MKKSESITKIAAALLLAQKEMGNALKDSKNPFFKSVYADLNSVREACIPALNKHGITALQPIVYEEGKAFVETILLHESGEFISSHTEIICDKQNNAQSQGSGTTYSRRYGLQSICNIGTEDDDGNAASGNHSDKTHASSSDAKATKEDDGRKWLNIWTSASKQEFTKEGLNTIEKLKAGTVTLETVEKNYKLSKEVKQFLTEQTK
jgi:hypothetical protein